MAKLGGWLSPKTAKLTVPRGFCCPVAAKIFFKWGNPPADGKDLLKWQLFVLFLSLREMHQKEQSGHVSRGCASELIADGHGNQECDERKMP